MWLRWLSQLAACVWTLASADMQLYHQQHHLLVQPKDTNRNNSLFGYTVAFQQLEIGTKRLLVGAPTADDVGRVYACPLNTAAVNVASDITTTCSPITVDALRIARVHAYLDEDDHSWKTLLHGHDLWLGSTIIVTGGDFITCAPRWSKKVNDEKDGHFVFGNCFKVDSAGRSTPMTTPTTEIVCDVCNTRQRMYVNGGVGWSAATAPAAVVGDEGLMVVGGPQTCTTGAYFSTHEAAKGISTWIGASTFGYEFFPPTNCPLPREKYSKVTMPTMNFGYAMVFGKFITLQFGNVLAVSSLYGKHNHGEVVLEDTEARFRDARVGSMFGAALCAARLHSGARDAEHDDLLVGAPLYAADLNSEEQGAVFLYYGGTHLQQDKIKYPEHVAILYGEGNKHRSYFGSAITNLGDADGDGNDEFAVGAPYEEEAGAVYVFSVWYEGRELRYTRQRLSPGLKGFGSSIAVLTDIDHNGCNEMAVGAFDSASVAVLHCQPVVTVEALTNIMSLQLWKLPVTARSFPFKSCVRVHYPPGIQVTRELSVNTTLKDLGGGVTLQPADQLYTVQLNPAGHNTICRTITVNTDPNRLSSRMEFTMLVSAQDDCFKGQYKKTCALLSRRSTLLIEKYVTSHRCTSGMCRPKLALQIMALGVDIGSDGGKLELGSKESVAIRLRVNNTGDGAYEWCMQVRVKGVISSRLSECDYDDIKHEYTCGIGKGLTSLLNGASGESNLILYTEHLTSEDTSVQVSAVVKNACHETTGIQGQLNINFFANPERISIKGISMEPKQVIDQVHQQRDSDRNTTIRHIYKVENEGPTTWKNISLQVSTDVFSFLVLETPQAKDVSCDKTSIQKPGVIRCYFAKIAPYSFVQITIPLVIVHRNVEYGLDNPVNITTTVTLEHKLFTISDSRKVAKGSTAVSSLDNSVLEWWHILLACLAALLLLALIVFILYKYGFFKRQTKKNLQALKRRSTMRQSQRMSRPAPPPPASAATK